MQDDRRRNRRFRVWLGAFEARSGKETNQGSLEVLGSRCMRSLQPIRLERAKHPLTNQRLHQAAYAT